MPAIAYYQGREFFAVRVSDDDVDLVDPKLGWSDNRFGGQPFTVQRDQVFLLGPLMWVANKPPPPPPEPWNVRVLDPEPVTVIHWHPHECPEHPTVEDTKYHNSIVEKEIEALLASKD